LRTVLPVRVVDERDLNRVILTEGERPLVLGCAALGDV
jgi:hypothetical protein